MSTPLYSRLRALGALRGMNPDDVEAVLELLSETSASLTLGTVSFPSPAPNDALTLHTANLAEHAPQPHAEATPRLGRFEVLARIGQGGMGEVLRVQDPTLNRTMALKVLHPYIARSEQDVQRFIDEAQITAQLRHPSVVPVHELGRLPDGRVYFTMEEIRGRTLSAVIEAVHHASADGPWRPTPDGWSLRRLIEALRRVAEGVAYAHSLGVLHRDLKPSNVMLGEFGEVSVLDWGLALLVGGRVADQPRLSSGGGDTRVAGTPGYMSPEQARGDVTAASFAADLFSLGAMLFKILTGRAPFSGEDASAVVQRVLSGQREPFTRWRREGKPLEDPYLPDALRQLCDEAMHPDPFVRLSDARRFEQALAAWLEGLARREQAETLIAAADARLAERAEHLARAASDRARAEALLDNIALHAPEEAKRPAWDLADSAEAHEIEARVALMQAIRLCQAALSHDPDHAPAHDHLADLCREDHEAAERAHRPVAAAAWEELLRSHDRGRHRAYLAGEGRLTLHVQPEGARVSAWRYELVGRRLRPTPLGELGVAPLQEVPLPRGSYLLVAEAPGHVPLKIPVKIERGGHWLDLPPGGADPVVHRLAPEGRLGPDDVLVPAGWFEAGGDPIAAGSLRARRVWLDPFVMRRHPVTHRELLAFLNARAEQDRLDELIQFIPRLESSPLYVRGEDGRFALLDLPSFPLHPDMPALMACFWLARAHADWEAERSGLPWTLPGDLEWEKAARGVDGRRLPWGDFMDPSWCNMRDSHPGHPLPVRVDAFPVDESPYGVRGMAGNIMDWCRDPYRVGGPPLLSGRVDPDFAARGDEHRVVRGGHWYGVGQIGHAAHRLRLAPSFTGYLVGYRLSRAAPEAMG